MKANLKRGFIFFFQACSRVPFSVICCLLKGSIKDPFRDIYSSIAEMPTRSYAIRESWQKETNSYVLFFTFIEQTGETQML